MLQRNSVTQYIQAKIRILTNQLSSQPGNQSTSSQKDTLMTLIVLSEMRHTYLKRSPSQVSSPNSTTLVSLRVHNDDGSKTHKWVLEGLFGACEQVTKTDSLIKKGYLSNLRIKVLMCNTITNTSQTSMRRWSTL